MLSFGRKKLNGGVDEKGNKMNPQDILERLRLLYKDYEYGDYANLPSLHQLFEIIEPYHQYNVTKYERSLSGEEIAKLAKELDDIEGILEQRIQLREKLDILQHKIKAKLGEKRGEQLSNLLYYLVDNTGCVGSIDYYGMKMTFYNAETTYGDYLQNFIEVMKEHLTKYS